MIFLFEIIIGNAVILCQCIMTLYIIIIVKTNIWTHTKYASTSTETYCYFCMIPGSLTQNYLSGIILG